MAVEIAIEKKFKGFHLRVELKSEEPMTGILGASGSGKSMTLRCIAGIETPDSGRIVLNGKTLYDSGAGIDLKPQERRVGYLFQDYALFPAMTVEQNIACGFRGRRSEGKEKAAEYIRRYRLEGLEKRYPAQLSGGQKQRAALARMMIGEPDMILLDEPFSAQDGCLKEIVQQDMREFLENYNGDMMLVTHNRDEIFKFCTRIALLKEGRTLVSGDRKEIFENPGTVEAARLTGCRNFSAMERLDAHHIYAADWGLVLRTARPAEEGHRFAAIRGHWLRPAWEPGENTMAVQAVGYVETMFEHQHLLRNAEQKDGAPIWWMRRKNSFEEGPEEEMPPYLYLAPEHLMLLRD